jgi:putative oxidoreductase
MLRKIIHTEADPALTLARVVLGFIFFVHGSQLMLGWFGGHGLSGSIQFFTQQLGVPAIFALLAICAQFFGGLLLILGLAGRVAALGIIGNMVVAVALVHWQFGLFMNWFGNQKGEGFEYHLLAMALGLVVVLRGSGALSLDRLLLKQRGNAPEEADGPGRTVAPVMTSQT